MCVRDRVYADVVRGFRVAYLWLLQDSSLGLLIIAGSGAMCRLPMASETQRTLQNFSCLSALGIGRCEHRAELRSAWVSKPHAILAAWKLAYALRG